MWPRARRCTAGTAVCRRARRPSHDERGAVTAETALVIPLLLAVTLGLVWLLSIGVAQIRTVDAAREAARAVARGDDTAGAAGLARTAAPDGARVTIRTGTDTVTATVTARVGGPGGMFGFLPSVRVHHRAVAVAEQGAP